MENNETKRNQADLDLFRKLVSDLGNKKKGELAMPRLSSSKGKLPYTCDLNSYSIKKHEMDHLA